MICGVFQRPAVAKGPYKVQVDGGHNSLLEQMNQQPLALRYPVVVQRAKSGSLPLAQLLRTRVLKFGSLFLASRYTYPLRA